MRELFTFGRLNHAMALFVATTILVASGCARVSRERTLPPSIHSVSVPMFVNRSAEPAIEEDATVYTQEEFLADGRLDLVAARDADAWIEVKITDFTNEGVSFDGDNFPRRVRFTTTARVEIVQNIPGKPLIGGPRTVTASHSFNNDKRSLTYVPEPEGKELVLRELARKIVEEVVTGGFGTDDI